MKFLKALGVSLLSFLLFLSLAIFGLAFMVHQTILNPGFITAEINKLDLPAITEEFIGEQVSGDSELVAEIMSGTVTDLEPWIGEQTHTITYATYDYLLGKSQSLSVAIPLEPVKESLENNIRKVVLESPPPELAGASPAQVEQFISEASQQITSGMPSTFELSESSLPTEVKTTMVQLRQVIGYFNIGYWALIGFMLLLVLGIVLINRNVKATTRSLGVNSLIYGVLEYAGIYAFNLIVEPQLMTAVSAGLPTAVQAWLPQMMADLLAPLQMFSIGLAAAGVVLIIVSFIYKPKPSLEPTG